MEKLIAATDPVEAEHLMTVGTLFCDCASEKYYLLII